ncbi:MAG: helix-hairpin-helix domain-containing protein [Endomicrobiales bacterium]|nr:helix-hairpin-helix domain-containing protein [Endomicrobiales bacterium]
MRNRLRIPILFLIAAVMVFGCALTSFAKDLQTFPNSRLVKDPENDGDSFLVKAGGKTLRLRLYFVDCPETSAASKTDARRLREQTRYFGLLHSTTTIQFGKEAKNFTEYALSRPFTVHTAFANAPGRSSKGRVYGFITTADGVDLGEMLVKIGFARTHGKRRKTHQGVSSAEMKKRLLDFEKTAMLNRMGIWEKAEPEKIDELRAMQRKEDRELEAIQKETSEKLQPRGELDINTATEKELRSVKGIGPVIAKRIIAGRPYKTWDDLLKVKGIGKKKLDSIRPYFNDTGGW